MKHLILLMVLPLLAACQTTDSGLVGAIRKSSSLAQVPSTTMPISTPTPDEELKDMGIRDFVKPKAEKKKEPTAFEKAQAIQKEKMPKIAEIKPKETIKTAENLTMLRQGIATHSDKNEVIEKLPLIPKEGIKVASSQPMKEIPVASGKTLMTLRFKTESAELTEFEKARLLEFSKKSNLPKKMTLKVGTDGKKKGIELLTLVNKRMQEILALLPMSVKINEVYSPDLEENTASLEVN